MKVHSPLGPYAPDRPGKLHEAKSFTEDFDRKFFEFYAFGWRLTWVVGSVKEIARLRVCRICEDGI